MRAPGVLVCLLGYVLGAHPGEPRVEPPDALPPTPAGQAWKLVWHDEFLTDYVRVYDLVDAATGQPVWKPKPLERR